MSNRGVHSYYKLAMDRGGYVEIGAPSAPAPVDANIGSAPVAPTEAPTPKGQFPDTLAENAGNVVASGGSLAVGGEVVVGGAPDVASVEADLVEAIKARRSLFHGDLASQDARYFDALDRVNQLRAQLTGLTDQPKSDEIYGRLVTATLPTDQQ